MSQGQGGNYLKLFMNILQTSYEHLTNILQTSYKHLTDVLQTSCLMNILSYEHLVLWTSCLMNILSYELLVLRLMNILQMYNDNHMNFLWDSYKLLMIFWITSFQILTNFFWTPHKLITYIWQTSYEIPINIWAFCKLHANFVQTSYHHLQGLSIFSWT